MLPRATLFLGGPLCGTRSDWPDTHRTIRAVVPPKLSLAVRYCADDEIPDPFTLPPLEEVEYERRDLVLSLARKEPLKDGFVSLDLRIEVRAWVLTTLTTDEAALLYAKHEYGNITRSLHMTHVVSECAMLAYLRIPQRYTLQYI